MLTSSSTAGREAKLQYSDASYVVLARGDYVVCAATDRKIPVEILCYWSVDRQEAYYDAAASTLRQEQVAEA